VWVVCLLLCILSVVLLLMLMLLVVDAEAVAGAAEGRVFAISGTETTGSLVWQVVEHVYPANATVAGGGEMTLDLSRSRGSRDAPRRSGR
jgi:hypothetical protein